MAMNPENVSFQYFVVGNGSVSKRLLLVQSKTHRVWVFNNSHTGYRTRIRYTGEDSPSQNGQLRFTIYNVTVQDAGTYYCQGSNGENVTGCRHVLVVAQRPTTPTITGPASPVSGENVTLTCSNSSSRSLPPDHPQLTMTYIWRRDRTLLESGDESPTGGDNLTITQVSGENQGDTYSCQAVEEGLESDWSHEHVLDVLYGPDQIQFHGTRDKLQVEEGKPVTVRCSADCNPACTVTWWDTSRQMVITGHRKAVLSIPAIDVSVSGQYTCHVNNSHGSASRNLTLEVFTRELNESGVVSIVPVTAVCSILIVIITVVVMVVVCRKQRRGGKGCTYNRVVTYTRDADTGGGYEEIVERGCARHRVVSYHREDENDGSYQEIEEGDANVDDIVPIVAVYSVMLTAVAVVVAAVTVLVCTDVKENQDNRFGEYLTVMAERLSHDFSDVPRASNNDVLPLYDYERLLRDQFHIYTSLHPSSSSTEDHKRPTTPTITGPASPVSGENVTLTCSSTSRSLPPDHPLLTMTYIWRRDRTLLESGDESPTGGDDLTIIHASRENWGDIYSCQAVEEGLKSDWSHEHVLNVLYGPDQIHFDGIRGKLEEGKPVTTRCSADCNPACTVTWWDTSRQMVMTGHRKAVLSIPAVDVSVSRHLVSYHREDENDGSYQEIEEGEANVDDIVPVVAVYSVMLTAVAVVVAAVAVLVCKDVKENQDNRCGDYLTVMAERLSHDFSDVPRASNNDVLPLHDYELPLREQFHIYTSLYPPSSSAHGNSTR
ncbi:carcinoembryonic antigen-related cell adhesion molecule 2-like [Haliotis asinina]|uniref:carcinoembryonic antigen-related cell adhesion molecule 2-like n=1 Tax=Haliotis asinina TaxID=109174 RepID=UPI00353261A8